MSNRVSIEPFPPSEFIREAMEARGWTQDDLAEVMGRNRHTVLRLLNGKSGVTPETAHELAKAFDSSAEVWMNLQTSYELSLAAKEDDAIEQRSKIYGKYPVRALGSRGWIPKITDVEKLKSALCGLLSVKSVDETPSLDVAARKSTPYDGHTGAQWAWYCYARSLASKVSAERFDKKTFAAKLPKLVALAEYPDDARRVPKALAEMGVKFAIVKHLPTTKIDGAAMWVDESPVVALSLRHDRMDNFWFTLMHELVHVKYGDQSPVDVDLTGNEESAIERRANEEAANYLIPKDKMDSFIARHKPLYYQKKVVQFAQARGIHPSIVVGQLKHRGGLPQTHFHKLQAKIRHSIVGHALTDGWE